MTLHVRLVNEINGNMVSYHNSYVSPYNEEYVSLDISSFLTLEYTEKDGEWDRSKSITITNRTIVQFIKGLRRIISNLEHGRVFGIREGTKEPVLFKDRVEENTVIINNIGVGQAVELRPAVIYDEDNDISYEGVVMYLNKVSHAVYLTTDELDALYHELSTMSLTMMSQLMINYHVAQSGKATMNPSVNLAKPKPKTHPLDGIPKAAETIQTTKKEAPPTNSTFGGLLKRRNHT